MKSSKKVALCGISTAFGSIFLIMVLFAPTGKLSLFALSSVAVMLPLAKKLYGGAFLTVIATGLIAFISGGLTVFLPYILIFGVHPLFNALLEKAVFKKGGILIKLLPKLLYFNVILFLLYKFAYLNQLIMVDIEFYLLAIVVSVVFIPYDFLMQAVQKRVEYILSRYVKY